MNTGNYQKIQILQVTFEIKASQMINLGQAQFNSNTNTTIDNSTEINKKITPTKSITCNSSQLPKSQTISNSDAFFQTYGKSKKFFYVEVCIRKNAASLCKK